MKWTDCEVLITGGTGSLGKEITKQLSGCVRGIRIYSRDEKKQWDMKQWLDRNGFQNMPISFLIGDIRDRERLCLAMRGVNIVIHTAAMKQVPACEYNPWEAVHTNTVGAWNVIHAALKNRSVQKVMNISTDKAVYPVNIYGVTKAAAEKLFIHSNVYSGDKPPRFSCCRYGNVIGSRGSVIPLFLEQVRTGNKLTVTHEDMTRFWITLPDAAKFVLGRTENMVGGEIFIPKMPSVRIVDVAKLIVSRHTGAAHAIPQAKITKIGVRQGEKIHECLIAKEEISKDFEEYFAIMREGVQYAQKEGAYTSDRNPWFLGKEEIIKILNDYLK